MALVLCDAENGFSENVELPLGHCSAWLGFSHSRDHR